MRDGLDKGARATRRFTVDRDRTIGFMGEEMRVYATPWMVRDIEVACRDFLGEYLDAAESSVGARVELDHLGATLLGAWVEVTATVAEVDGRRVAFEVEVRDALDLVGRARHLRVVVDLERQRRRLEAKAARFADLDAEPDKE